jgi:beta-lactamase regulating signal transducer with metallopeptidase domain
MRDGLILGLLLESALRSLVLGTGVMALLKLARLRDPKAETLAWTLVLIASLLMPFLSRWLPGAVTVPIPHFAAPAPAAFAGISVAPSAPLRPSLFLATVFWTVYCAVAAIGFTRLIVGLVLTHRFYRTAQPVDATWAWGRNIRVSDRIHGPLSFGAAILLPADYQDWPQAKLLAVLAHEESHIERGDFFIQLLASAHRALFWFNPFAWWLQARLGELAETASDEAAIRRIQDAPRYAEILLEVSRKAQPTTFSARGAALGMAHGPSVARRLDHVLTWRPSRSLGLTGRVAGAGLLLAATVGLAEVRAAAIMLAPQSHRVTSALAGAAQGQATRPDRNATGAPSSVSGAPVDGAPVNRNAIRAGTPAGIPVEVVTSSPVGPAQPEAEPDFTYNPRALLEGPEVAAIGSFVILDKKTSQPAD